ncbi:MAG TPA: hypothetical protein VMU18_02325 [Rhodoblastus sp.]|nr:hypothetical protein [Rhodoblastus sp.]
MLSALPVLMGLQLTEAPAAPKPEARRGLTRADLDAALEAFGKSQASTLASKDEVSRGLAQLREELMQRLQSADKAAADREKEISDKIEAHAKSDADQMQKLRATEETDKPWWRSALFVALVPALISAGVAFAVARQNLAASRDQQQKSVEDLRQQQKKALARELSSRWQDKEDEVAKAFWVLEHPNELADAGQRNRVTKIGNFYNHIAQQWRSGAADAADLEQENFRALFDNFKQALEKAHGQGADVKALVDTWPSIWEICGRPHI